MAIRRQHIQKKRQSNPIPNPVTGMFKPRPFAIPAEPEAATAPELQTKVEPEQIGGNRLSRIDVSTPPPIQPKLTIGAPNDKYEQEADTIARKVIQQIRTPTPPDANGSGGSVQRQMFSTPSIMRLTVQRREAIEEVADASVPAASVPAASAPSPQSDAKRKGSQFNIIADYSWIRDTLQECQSWDKVKQLFASQKESMWQFFDFRQWYVDSLINVMRDTYPGLIAKSVGSQDPTSDYDITISTPGSGDDVEAIQWFNAQVRKEFGVEPGTLFDTNLYAKDYLQVKENIDEAAVAGQNPDADLEQPDGAFGSMGHLSQDVAALVKQRRYMKQVEWDRYVDDVVQGIDDPERKKLTLLQYEEADSVYQIFAHELLQKVEEDPDLQKNPVGHPVTLGPEEEAALSQIKSPDDKLRSIIREQLLGSEKLQAITHDKPDLVLQKSNELYLERMRKVRQLQLTIRELGNEPEKSEQVKVLKAQVKQILGEACFFAAEAYHSEGAVKHIVAGIQGAKNPEQKEAIMGSLKPEHFLQSFNEQLGDFLKDLNHYAGEQDGKIFYRSSKYLYRLFLAVAELRKYQFQEDFGLKIENERGKSDGIAQKINQDLVEIRKGNKAELDTDEKKNQAAEAAMQKILGVKTASELKVKILQMAMEFNTRVRNRAAELSAPSLETSKSYFKNIR